MIRSKGLERITVDELVQIITPRGRGTSPGALGAARVCLYMHVAEPIGSRGFCFSDTVPDQIKADLLQRIRQFLQST